MFSTETFSQNNNNQTAVNTNSGLNNDNSTNSNNSQIIIPDDFNKSENSFTIGNIIDQYKTTTTIFCADYLHKNPTTSNEKDKINASLNIKLSGAIPVVNNIGVKTNSDTWMADHYSCKLGVHALPFYLDAKITTTGNNPIDEGTLKIGILRVILEKENVQWMVDAAVKDYKKYCDGTTLTTIDILNVEVNKDIEPTDGLTLRFTLNGSFSAGGNVKPATIPTLPTISANSNNGVAEDLNKDVTGVSKAYKGDVSTGALGAQVSVNFNERVVVGIFGNMNGFLGAVRNDLRTSKPYFGYQGDPATAVNGAYSAVDTWADLLSTKVKETTIGGKVDWTPFNSCKVGKAFHLCLTVGATTTTIAQNVNESLKWTNYYQWQPEHTYSNTEEIANQTKKIIRPWGIVGITYDLDSNKKKLVK